MIKETKRKGFNFFRSYFDVYNELGDADKLAFIDALLNRQFLGIVPENLTGMAKFAYISQTHNINSQVKGYEDKTGVSLTPCLPPCLPPTHGVVTTPTEQVIVIEKEKVIEVLLSIKQIDNYILELKSQHQFLDALYMTYKFKPKTIGKIANLFKEHLKMFPKQHETFLDFRNHFKSWIGFETKKGNLGEFLKHQKGEL